MPAQQDSPAEDYHMNYYNENKGAPTFSLIISPKLGKQREKLGERMTSLRQS